MKEKLYLKSEPPMHVNKHVKYVRKLQSTIELKIHI